MLRLLPFLTATLLSWGALAAEEVPARLAVSFYAFGYAPGLQDIQVATGRGKLTKVELSTANIVGPLMATVEAGRIALWGPPVTDDQGETTHPVAGTALIRDGLQRALVVLLPESGEKGASYRTLVLENDAGGFPLGTYRLLNLGSHPVRGAVGGTIVQAKPGGIATLKLEGEPGTVLPVRFEYQQGGRWNRLTETRCAVRKDRRWLMCIYQDPKTGRMNIRSIPDRTVTPVGGD